MRPRSSAKNAPGELTARGPTRAEIRQRVLTAMSEDWQWLDDICRLTGYGRADVHEALTHFRNAGQVRQSRGKTWVSQRWRRAAGNAQATQSDPPGSSDESFRGSNGGTKAASDRVRGQLSTVEQVQHFIEHLLPDEALRMRCMSIFADSVDRIRSHGPSKWGAYCAPMTRDRVRLLCGTFIVLTINKHGAWLTLDKETLESSQLKREALEAAGGWRFDKKESPDGYPSYTRVSSVNIYYTPNDEHDRNWPPIRALHFAFLDRVALKHEHLSVASQRTHQPSLVQYLRVLLKRNLPDPIYPTARGADGDATDGPHARVAPALLDHMAQELNDGGAFDVSGIEDARQRVLASIVRRQGQPTFRRQLLEMYEGACAFSGCTVPETLDAAHILPYKGESTNHPQNGLLLRTDIHTLFDMHLITVESSDLSILVAPCLQETEYASLSGKKMRVPANPALRPSTEALDEHRRTFHAQSAKPSPRRTARRLG